MTGHQKPGKELSVFLEVFANGVDNICASHSPHLSRTRLRISTFFWSKSKSCPILKQRRNSRKMATMPPFGETRFSSRYVFTGLLIVIFRSSAAPRFCRVSIFLHITRFTLLPSTCSHENHLYGCAKPQQIKACKHYFDTSKEKKSCLVHGGYHVDVELLIALISYQVKTTRLSTWFWCPSETTLLSFLNLSVPLERCSICPLSRRREQTCAHVTFPGLRTWRQPENRTLDTTLENNNLEPLIYITVRYFLRWRQNQRNVKWTPSLILSLCLVGGIRIDSRYF